jgi:hypothetical protein
MKLIRCPDCREPVSPFARACSYCGAPYPARRSLAIAGAVTAVLLAAIGIAALFALRPAAPPTGVGKAPAGTTGDFVWLSAALRECDKDAAKDPGALHFIVTPLVDAAKDEPGWRRISLNDVGNAILIKADDMIAGLKRGALRISPAEYVFAIRNESTNIVYKWNPAVGVKRFSSPKAEDVEKFRIQFQSRSGTGSLAWGAVFGRRPGNCYWVNAIILLQGP